MDRGEGSEAQADEGRPGFRAEPSRTEPSRAKPNRAEPSRATGWTDWRKASSRVSAAPALRSLTASAHPYIRIWCFSHAACFSGNTAEVICLYTYPLVLFITLSLSSVTFSINYNAYLLTSLYLNVFNGRFVSVKLRTPLFNEDERDEKYDPLSFSSLRFKVIRFDSIKFESV